MNTYIALLRGINVGGKNSLPMKELIAILAELGCENAKTYIQSGNAVFASKTKSTAALANKLTAAIEKQRGFAPPVVVLTLKDLERAIEGNPFPEAQADHKSLHLGFLAAAPASPNLDNLESLRTKSERYKIAGQVFYLHAPDGIGKSKLAASAEKLLGVTMTMRNWRTVCTIREMAETVVG